jgi:hypothetical protein
MNQQASKPVTRLACARVAARLGVWRQRGLTTGIALTVAATAGCQADFDPGSRVTSLRVLAVQADRPFAAPGESVHFESLSYDPAGRALSWGWATCVNPADSTVEGCLTKIEADAEAAGETPAFVPGMNTSSFDYTIPAEALEGVAASARPAAVVGVLNAACPGAVEIGTSTASIPFACRDDSGRALALDEFVIGIKHVRIRGTDRNQNPVLTSIAFDGADWPPAEIKAVEHCASDSNLFDDCKAKKHDLAANVSADSFEAGRDEFGAAFSEDLVTEYYATEGTFKDEVRISQDPKTSWVARKSAAGQDVTLWFVVHDDRGGVAWDTRRVHVE